MGRLRRRPLHPGGIGVHGGIQMDRLHRHPPQTPGVPRHLRHRPGRCCHFQSDPALYDVTNRTEPKKAVLQQRPTCVPTYLVETHAKYRQAFIF